MKYIFLLIIFMVLIGFVINKRSKNLREKYSGKSEEEIRESLKKTLP